MKDESNAKSFISISHEQLDPDPYRCGASNGTIDLKTGTLLAPDPADFITKLLGAPFDPNATCALWMKFLRDVFAGDESLVEYFQRLIGYCLTGLTTEQVIVFFYGSGANGKSVALTIIKLLLGDYGLHAAAETLSPKHGDTVRSDLARLDGARLVTCSETADGKTIDEPLVKSLTGGDPITARRLYAKEFSFIPTCKFLLATNYRPVIRGGEAIWRRIQLVPFMRTFAANERDFNLTNKLKEELPGILAWAVRGCLEWQRIGLSPPQAVLAATEAYRADSDTFGHWMEDSCVIADGATMQVKPAFNNYVKWAEAQLAKPMSMMAFSRKLVERNFPKEKRGVVMFIGIGLRVAGEGENDPLDF